MHFGVDVLRRRLVTAGGRSRAGVVAVEVQVEAEKMCVRRGNAWARVKTDGEGACRMESTDGTALELQQKPMPLGLVAGLTVLTSPGTGGLMLATSPLGGCGMTSPHARDPDVSNRWHCGLPVQCEPASLNAER